MFQLCLSINQVLFCVNSRHVELDVLVPQLEDGVCCAISISKDCQGNEVGKKCQCVLEFSSTVPISRMDFLIVTERSSGQKLVAHCFKLLDSSAFFGK